MNPSPDEIERRFTHHAPDSDKALLHRQIREDCATLAYHLAHSLPEGREKSLALTHVEEAMFWANAAVARS